MRAANIVGCAIVLTSGALAVACGGSPATDAGSDTAAPDAVDIVVDVRPDVAPDVPSLSALFNPCVHDTDCAALSRGRCLTNYPGGICSIRCANDRSCGPTGTGACVNGMCLPACTGAMDLTCDTYGSLCLTYAAMSYACFPSCWTAGPPPDLDPMHALCATGTTCAPEDGECLAMAPTGADNGGPCMANGDCKSGRCLTELDAMGNPTGFIGGYCFSIGRFPGNAAFNGTTLPQSNCPHGDVMFGVAMLSVSGGGGIGTCRAGCMVDADCRAGYRCNHSPLVNMRVYSNGACLPVNCNMSGMTCPTGYGCITPPSDAAMPFGICAAGAGDGGVGDGGGGDAARDGASDASTEGGLDVTLPDAGVPDVGLPDLGGTG